MADSTVMICFQFCPKTLCISGRTLAGFWGWQWLIISNTHSKPIVYVFDHLLKLGKLSKIALRFSFWKIVPTWKNILVCLLVDGAFCLSQKLGLWQILNWSKSRRSLHSIQCMLKKFLVSVSKTPCSFFHWGHASNEHRNFLSMRNHAETLGSSRQIIPASPSSSEVICGSERKGELERADTVIPTNSVGLGCDLCP